MARLSPEERSRWYGRDHGLTYLRCRYTVSVNGKSYRYEHIAGQEVGSGRSLDPAVCSSAAEKRKVEAELVSTTRGCSDPHAGAYGGFDLVDLAR